MQQFLIQNPLLLLNLFRLISFKTFRWLKDCLNFPFTIFMNSPLLSIAVSFSVPHLIEVHSNFLRGNENADEVILAFLLLLSKHLEELTFLLLSSSVRCIEFNDTQEDIHSYGLLCKLLPNRCRILMNRHNVDIVIIY